MWLAWEKARLQAWVDSLPMSDGPYAAAVRASLQAPKTSTRGARRKLSDDACKSGPQELFAPVHSYLKQLPMLAPSWQHGVLTCLHLVPYAYDVRVTSVHVDALTNLLMQPVCQFLQELEVPWSLHAENAAWMPAVAATLCRAGVRLRVLRIGHSERVLALHDIRRPSARQRRRIELAQVFGDAAAEIVDPRRGLLFACAFNLALPLWQAGPADNPTRHIQLETSLGKAPLSAKSLTLVARGLWDRSSRVRARALLGLSQVGLGAAALMPDLLRMQLSNEDHRELLHDQLTQLGNNRTAVGAMAERLRPDKPAHLRWLQHTRMPTAAGACGMLRRALAIVPVPLEFGSVPPQWQRQIWRDVLRHLEQL